MDRFRDLVFFRNYFEEFYDNQQERVKEKIDAVLFNGFQKKSQKTPEVEIGKALRIKNEYYIIKDRINEPDK
jgi:hypothetical protein